MSWLRMMYTKIMVLVALMAMPLAALPDRVKILSGNVEAYQARVDLIRQARSELFITYFVVRDDAASINGFALLLDAAKRGVKVKIILDAFHQDISLPYLKALKSHPNIEIREFNRVSMLHLLRSLKRTHEKIILADNNLVEGYHYITGGRNISNKYFGFGESRNFDDLDVYVYSVSDKTVRDDYYLNQWNSPPVKEISLGPYSGKNLDDQNCPMARKEHDFCSRMNTYRKKKIQSAIRQLEMSFDTMVAGKISGIDPMSTRRWDQIAGEVGTVSFLFDPPHKPKSKDGIAEDLYQAIISHDSIKELTIVSPYVILTDRGARLISDLVERQVEITLITNSLNSTDNILAQAGYANEKKWILEQGVRVFHYTGPDTMHAKAIVINRGESVLIGSYNFDPRSAMLNREIGVHFSTALNSDGVIRSDLESMLDTFISKSHLIDRSGIPVGFEKEHPNASAAKKLLLNILRPIVSLPAIHKNL